MRSRYAASGVARDAFVRRTHRPHLGHRGRPVVVQFTRVPHGQNPKALQTLRQ